MASTSASIAGPIADASEQRPRKRRKRSSSIPAAPRSSQLSAQLQPRRRSRSRVGSPTADVEYVPPSRVSARLARKIHPFINSRSSDIYTHLADPDGAGNLLSEPPAGSVILSIPNEVVGSQSVKQPGGRRRKIVNLADENAKKDLMEEWARMRQSQGTLPLSGIDENACFSQMLLRDVRKGDGSVSSTQLEAMMRKSSADSDPAENETTTIIDITRSQETILDVSPGSSFSTRIDFENVLPTGAETSVEKLDHEASVLPSDGGTEQPIVPGIDVEALSASIPDPHIDEASPRNELAGIPETTNHIDLLRCPGSSPPILSASPSREDSVHPRHTKLTKFTVNEQAETASLNDPLKSRHPMTSQMSLFDSNNIHLDSDEEFYMLDIPEVFTLPWVPVASRLYVPPSLGKLISGKQVF
ncbi:hypothetical protein J3R83DRAFT_6727 [Lanmaoa asiatica]|nr:hypothetical protein J3R83DRAFT_6727 [Lanmaoa asiatica]